MTVLQGEVNYLLPNRPDGKLIRHLIDRGNVPETLIMDILQVQDKGSWVPYADSLQLAMLRNGLEYWEQSLIKNGQSTSIQINGIEERVKAFDIPGDDRKYAVLGAYEEPVVKPIAELFPNDVLLKHLIPLESILPPPVYNEVIKRAMALNRMSFVWSSMVPVQQVNDEWSAAEGVYKQVWGYYRGKRQHLGFITLFRVPAMQTLERSIQTLFHELIHSISTSMFEDRLVKIGLELSLLNSGSTFARSTNELMTHFLDEFINQLYNDSVPSGFNNAGMRLLLQAYFSNRLTDWLRLAEGRE